MRLLSLALIVAAAIPATLFPFVYGWTARRVWWTVPAGRALMASALALASLLDLTLVFRIWPPSHRVGMVVTLAVIGLIAIGAWLTLGALLHSLRGRRRRHGVPPSP